MALLTATLVINQINTSGFSSAQLNLFNRNKPNFVLAERELRKRGFGNEKCLLAIHANIWHESKGDPMVRSGQFTGIFQIGGDGTMGHGTTVAQRQDIPTAVNIVASKPYFVTWYKKHKYQDTTARDAATGFAKNVLRCAPHHVTSRGSTARSWKPRL